MAASRTPDIALRVLDGTPLRSGEPRSGAGLALAWISGNELAQASAGSNRPSSIARRHGGGGRWPRRITIVHSTTVPAISEMANSVIGPKPRRAYLVTLTAVPQNSDAVISAASRLLPVLTL